MLFNSSKNQNVTSSGRLKSDFGNSAPLFPNDRHVRPLVAKLHYNFTYRIRALYLLDP